MRSVSEATTVEARDEGTSETDITSPEDHAVPLTDNALKVLKRRYLRKDEGGRVIETPEQMFRRVSKAVAAADQLYNLSTDNSKIETEFYNMMSRLEFLPNSPTLMNAGTELGQLSACFVLPVDDSMSSIFDAVKATALIHQSGGGTGFSFSRLRPAGDIVGSTGGIASGPISFMRVFDTATDVIKQGGRRRGANMGILRVDHPDIFDFISCKEQEGQFSNFNISVAVTDKFMRAVEEGKPYDLINPRTGEVVRTVEAREVFDVIIEHAWRNGEPGLILLDRMNEFNPTPQLGEYESTNPCGEQVLLPYESCNLGSINLSKMLTPDHRIDWNKLERVVKTAVHFMDNVITVNRFPMPEFAEATLRTRKIGLGVMGFSEMLIRLNIPYNSPEAEAIGAKIMEAVNYWSKEASIELGQRRGNFPAFEESIYAQGRLPIPMREEEPVASEVLADAPQFDWEELARRIQRKGIRNATTTTIAPTGSISIIAGTSSGIEPIFALAYMRKHILDADELIEINSLFEQVAKERGFYTEEIMREVAIHGSIQDIETIPEDVRRVFVTAHDISPIWHIRMQAAFQAYTDNAVSKTINFPSEATLQDVRQAYLEAYHRGCKGLTVYRDKSREAQVLNVGVEGHERKRGDGLVPRVRPTVTHGTTEKIALGCGRYLYVTVNEDEVGLCEVFVQMGKGGGCTASQSEAVGRLISLALRSGVEPSTIIRQLRGIRCPSPSWHDGKPILSCADAIGRALERYLTREAEDRTGRENTRYLDAPGLTHEAGGKSFTDLCPECPDCGSLLEIGEGCMICRSCGYSQCG